MAKDLSNLKTIAVRYAKSNNIKSFYIGTSTEGGELVHRFIFITEGSSFDWDLSESLVILHARISQADKDIRPHCMAIPSSCEEDISTLLDDILEHVEC